MEKNDAVRASIIRKRFEVLGYMTDMAIKGVCRSLVVSGPAGLGKTYTVEKHLNLANENKDPSVIWQRGISGYSRATYLFKSMYECRNVGNVLWLDDCDNVFTDDVGLNLLKKACDTTEQRWLTWGSQATFDDENGELIPTTFQFQGAMIFLTNLDFDALIQKGHKFAPHLSALISRSHYIDLAMKTRRDYLLRMQQVIGDGMLDYLSPKEKSEVLHFIGSNQEHLREYSLRIVHKIAQLRQAGHHSWEDIATITCLKQ